MHRLYNGTWPPNDPMAPHSIWTATAQTTAWTEGFADAVGAYLLNDNRFVYGSGDASEYTYGSGWHVSDLVEGNVAGSLLDLWRNTDGGWDRTLDVLTAKQPGGFSAYFGTARPAANPPLATDSAALTLLARHTIDYGPSVVGDGKYHTLTDGSGLVLERTGGCTNVTSTTAGLNTFDATRSWQRWRIDANADGTVRITDGCPQPLALTVPSPLNLGGTVVLKAYDPADSNQKWKTTKSNGTLRITEPLGGLALDRSNSTAGSVAVLNRNNPNSNSQFWGPIN